MITVMKLNDKQWPCKEHSISFTAQKKFELRASTAKPKSSGVEHIGSFRGDGQSHLNSALLV